MTFVSACALTGGKPQWQTSSASREPPPTRMQQLTTQFLTPIFALATLFAVVFLLPYLIPLLKLFPCFTFIGGFSLVAFCGFAMLLSAPSLAGLAGTAVALFFGAWYAFGAVRHYRRLLKGRLQRDSDAPHAQ